MLRDYLSPGRRSPDFSGSLAPGYIQSAFQAGKSSIPSMKFETNSDYQNWLKAILNSARGCASAKASATRGTPLGLKNAPKNRSIYKCCYG